MNTLEAYGASQCSPHTYFKNALTLFQNQQLPDALQSIDAAIVFSTNSPFYIYQKIRILFDLGAFKSCSQLIVSQLDYLYKHASLYIVCRVLDYFQKINQYDVATLENILNNLQIPYILASCYESLLTQKKKEFFHLAKKAMYQDHFALCLCYCSLEAKISFRSNAIINMEAFSHHMLGHLSEAQAAYMELIKQLPNESVHYIHVAFILMELGKFQDAMTYFDQACELEPTNKQYILYLGECYYQAKQYGAAIKTYKQLAKLDPSNLQNIFNLAHAYAHTGRKILSKYYLKQIKKQLDQSQHDIPTFSD